MPYYPEFDLVFIHIPKTAGGAIEELLLPYKAPGRKTLLRRLAAKLALPPRQLSATLDEYNRACTPGTWKPLELDGLATRDLMPPKSNWALPIAKAPFHAYPIMSANVFTFGGLKTDRLGRVLDADGEPIARLYAAGEMTGLYFGNYTGSTSVLRGMVFGRIAGRNAAGFAKK